MSLTQIVAAGVEQAFAAAGDLISSGTYTVRTGASGFNPSTGLVTTTTSTIANVRMARTSLTMEEREASPISVCDVKVLIPAVDLGGIKPNETDTFNLDGLGYNVVQYRGVPGDILWIIYATEQ